MHKINIKLLQYDNASHIEQYLSPFRNKKFEFIIPRNIFTSGNDSYDLLWQYHTAAYAGQLLADASSQFSYYIPDPKSHDAFRFKIQPGNITLLSENLAHIIGGMFTEEDTVLGFQQEAADYLDNVFEGKKDSDTWGLIHIAGKYLDRFGQESEI